MSHWLETHQVLIERAQRIAEGDQDAHSVGFDRRLLDALDDYMKDIGRHDHASTHLMGVALATLGDPPFRDNP
ncbi:MAG: hypothetical protein AAGI01_03325, partial [Myxococcota bacterium]